MPRRLLPCLAALFLFGAPLPAGAQGTDVAAENDAATAITAEERDRLARERRELADREAALRRQLETQRRLKAQQDALIEELRRELRALGGD